MLFIQTVLHNPTGWSSTAANLHKVLVLAQQYGVLIAEDDVHGHFHPDHATRLASLSGLDRVIYYSSFCKALSPGLRIGYVGGRSHAAQSLMREKIYSVLAAGRWRKHLDRLNTKLLDARQVSARQLTAAGLVLYHPTEAHIRFNVAFSQQPRLAEYLHERLQSLAGARAALARVSAAADHPLLRRLN